MADQVDMLTRFFQSNKPRAVEARQIPNLAVKFFDLNGQFQKNGFKLMEKVKEPTQFTDNAMNYYNVELGQLTNPEHFIPTEQGISLNRWTNKTPYTVPGAAGLNQI